jgi:hypothetical protein
MPSDKKEVCMIKLIALFLVIVMALLFVKYVAFWFKLIMFLVAVSAFGYICWRLYGVIKAYLGKEETLPRGSGKKYDEYTIRQYQDLDLDWEAEGVGNGQQEGSMITEKQRELVRLNGQLECARARDKEQEEEHILATMDTIWYSLSTAEQEELEELNERQSKRPFKRSYDRPRGSGNME